MAECKYIVKVYSQRLVPGPGFLVKEEDYEKRFFSCRRQPLPVLIIILFVPVRELEAMVALISYFEVDQ